MARYIGPVCKLCRREGSRLFLKGTRCEGPKCAIAKREYPPGPRSFRRRRTSEYGRQLREKQKVKRWYGTMERQFRAAFSKADQAKGNTGENLLLLFERRLDNVIYLLGMAQSRPQARQWINHGHFQVNGRRCSIPSYQVREGDEITTGSKENIKNLCKESREITRGRPTPDWLSLDEDNLKATVARMPVREDVSVPAEEQLIVEFCSK